MKKFLITLFLFCNISSGFCDEISDALQVKLNVIRTMSAQFNQVVKVKNRELSHSTGTMALSRPGHFRWQTIAPMEQIVVADGRRLWVYDVDLEQVTVKKQDKSLGTTAGLFLSSYNEDLARDFNISSPEKNTFDLRAKSNKANFQRVKLTFSMDALSRIELYDQLGQLTDVNLTHIKVNPPVAESLFIFNIPKGVDVVEQ
jgi:outer membrane lipoprotein carrier protein